MDKYLTPQQVAERLGISRRHVYEMLKSIPHVKLARNCVRVAESEIERYLEARTKRTTTLEWSPGEPASEPAKPPPAWRRPLKLRKRRT